MILAKTRMDELPDYCFLCNFSFDDFDPFGRYEFHYFCGVTLKKIDDVFSKPDCCPLIE